MQLDPKVLSSLNGCSQVLLLNQGCISNKQISSMLHNRGINHITHVDELNPQRSSVANKNGIPIVQISKKNKVTVAKQ